MRSDITIEKIDELKFRIPGITYAQAKEALIQADGSVVDAIIILEQHKGISNATKKAKKVMEDVLPKDTEDFKEIGEQIKELLKKSNVIRVIVEKNNKNIINIPLTVGVVGAALLPIYTLVGLSAAIITKYHIKIQDENDGTIINLGELNEEKLNLLKKMLANTAREVKGVVTENKKDTKDITDELMEEEE